jgi:hypothetical protein
VRVDISIKSLARPSLLARLFLLLAFVFIAGFCLLYFNPKLVGLSIPGSSRLSRNRPGSTCENVERPANG